MNNNKNKKWEDYEGNIPKEQSYINNKRLRSDLIEWLNNEGWGNALAYTFTFPSGDKNREWVMNMTKIFFNAIDKKVYGGHSRHRKPRRCQRINAIEHGANNNNYHIHGIIKVPSNGFANKAFTNIDRFRLMMGEVWESTVPFNRDITPYRYQIEEPNNPTLGHSPEQWITYFSKTMTKLNPEAICLNTLWQCNDDGKSLT
ncbi:hypothetical protein MTBPR1_50094 [Candidatus Terasakiella magnetica]|uniref:Uncharacterized protein n=1 Tax=Candidatus Terasakiella magnetica TaxID=1867952 RepID=A0A1C3RJA6_9PROT|nr:hypothetical protein [Candidatus Terasakiella magnetica]SCA57338.1 hypothetical protein MTBPR1_50094 [Candidatus Terasakiella magnetica]